MLDPRETRDGLSVRPLGHHIYLAAKAKGDTSMCGKARCSETTKRYARRDPDGRVKAVLLEPKCPNCKGLRLGKVVDAQVLRDHDGPRPSIANTPRGSWVAICNPKDTKWAPRAVLNVKHARKAGSPKERKLHGDGVPIVV